MTQNSKKRRCGCVLLYLPKFCNTIIDSTFWVLGLQKVAQNFVMSDFSPILVLQICIKPYRRGKDSNKIWETHSFWRNIFKDDKANRSKENYKEENAQLRKRKRYWNDEHHSWLSPCRQHYILLIVRHWQVQSKEREPTTSREQYQACLEYCRGAKEEDHSQMAHIWDYFADHGSYWRQYRSMGRYAALASQDDAQEI